MKIMAAVDFSAYGDFVLTKAIKTARQQNAKLDIVIVVEESDHGRDSAETKHNSEKRFQESMRAARNYQQKAIDQGIKAKVRAIGVMSGLGG